MKAIIYVVVALLLGGPVFLSNTMAADVSVFGPHLAERGKGKSVSETHSFVVFNPVDKFKLKIKNGDNDGKNRVSSLSLLINGIKAASQDELNQKVDMVEKSISLQEQNQLTVKINGFPGSFVEISILGDDNGTGIDPTAILTVEPDAIEVGQSAMLRWQTSNADSTSLEPGFGVVVPDGSQLVSPNQSTTYTLKASRGGQEATSTVTLTVTTSHCRQV